MRIAADLLEQIVEHAQRDKPNECCGVVAARDGTATEVYALENLAASPMRFDVDGPVLARLLDEIEDRGEELAAIYHSHTRSAPEPSQTDINFAKNWPGVEWIIVGTKPVEPEVRSWSIDAGGEVSEVEVDVG